MLIEMVRRDCRPSLILFADTGGERPETYANNAEFSAWLVSKGFPSITTVTDGRRTLENEIWDANTLPSIAFGFKSCSDKYKIRPQNRFLAAWQPAIDAWEGGGKVVKFIGYDAGEVRRAKDYDTGKYVVTYPLMEWGWDRRKCSAVVRAEGFSPSKSACFYCPNSKPHEVIELAKTHPELFARAVQLERNATSATTVKGLGRQWSWEALVAADEAQFKMFQDLSEDQPCGCIT